MQTGLEPGELSLASHPRATGSSNADGPCVGWVKPARCERGGAVGNSAHSSKQQTLRTSPRQQLLEYSYYFCHVFLQNIEKQKKWQGSQPTIKSSADLQRRTRQHNLLATRTRSTLREPAEASIFCEGSALLRNAGWQS